MRRKAQGFSKWPGDSGSTAEHSGAATTRAYTGRAHLRRAVSHEPMSSTHSTVAAAGLAANTDGAATATATATAAATAGSADSRCVMRDRSQKSLFAVTSYLLKVLHSRLRSLSYILSA
ncbi:hypothetical protein K440DRAFT_324753 [Wilcoxina mikolae CBS 423.85]|nr:hypothetical protein K440DRAFT_324753 [Wilcoxina mikolae CBS 423.85]